jgi:rhodanese-related sulfurtransferase
MHRPALGAKRCATGGRNQMVDRFVSAIVFGVLVTTAAFADDPEPSEAPSISAAELHAQRESDATPAILDVRTPEEYASGHIPGAVNIPFEQVAERIAEIDATNGVAVYCMIGPRARKGEAALLAAGHEKVFHLEGGMSAWQAAGFPVEGAE